MSDIATLLAAALWTTDAYWRFANSLEPDQHRRFVDFAAAILATPEGQRFIEAIAKQERERLRATMAKWDGDDWFRQPQNERIVMLLDHYEHPIDPEEKKLGEAHKEEEPL